MHAHYSVYAQELFGISKCCCLVLLCLVWTLNPYIHGWVWVQWWCSNCSFHFPRIHQGCLCSSLRWRLVTSTCSYVPWVPRLSYRYGNYKLVTRLSSQLTVRKTARKHGYYVCAVNKLIYCVHQWTLCRRPYSWQIDLRRWMFDIVI